MTASAAPLRPGDKLASTACTTKVVIIRIPAERRPLIACGGSPMVPALSAPQPLAAEAGAAPLIGKRYVGGTEAVETLCAPLRACGCSVAEPPRTRHAAQPL